MSDRRDHSTNLAITGDVNPSSCFDFDQIDQGVALGKARSTGTVDAKSVARRRLFLGDFNVAGEGALHGRDANLHFCQKAAVFLKSQLLAARDALLESCWIAKCLVN